MPPLSPVVSFLSSGRISILFAMSSPSGGDHGDDRGAVVSSCRCAVAVVVLWPAGHVVLLSAFAHPVTVVNVRCDPRSWGWRGWRENDGARDAAAPDQAGAPRLPDRGRPRADRQCRPRHRSRGAGRRRLGLDPGAGHGRDAERHGRRRRGVPTPSGTAAAGPGHRPGDDGPHRRRIRRGRRRRAAPRTVRAGTRAVQQGHDPAALDGPAAQEQRLGAATAAAPGEGPADRGRRHRLGRRPGPGGVRGGAAALRRTGRG